MYNKFVQTGNVARFLEGIGTLEDRGAPEACLVVVSGDAGFGKSRTGQWWAVQNDAVFVRIKAATTPHWIMTDVVRELGEHAPSYTCEKLFTQIVDILARTRRPLVFDEVEHAVRDAKAIDTIRDIADLVEVPTILIGRDHVKGALQRHKQVWSRVAAHVRFKALTRDDVDACFDALCQVTVEPEARDHVFRQCDGRIRELVKGVANAERIGKRLRRPVTLKDVERIDLTRERGAAATAQEAA